MAVLGVWFWIEINETINQIVRGVNVDKLQEIKDKYMYWEYDFNLNKEDINWLIEQTEKLEEIRKVFYAEDKNVVDGYRKIIEVFEGKEVPTRNSRS